ncbi:LacI family DNA-binding transcriptional regulator [Phyllobacterium phragmitis]|uniref:LacI family DNA-binding transcriptional regulator n=1 Tax=Phyllobacterium phragmitis TaxID=2670329 RepID=A0ABQ0GUT0_9HYPH
MAKRPTIADLAAEAGVSVATVDRVLNGRLPVREETARRVYEAANAIGYHAAGLIRHRLQQDLPHYHLGFILQRPDQPFYQAFARELKNAVENAQGFRGTAHIDHFATRTPAEVASKLKEMAGRCRAVAMVAVDHPTITAAVADLREKGIPVFSLLSDFASGARESYIGLDNRKVGRTAAWMIAKAAKKPGKVAIFVGSHRFHGHELREIGFRTFFREHAPEFEVIDTLVNLDDHHIAQEASFELLQRYPDLAGLYLAGGGMEGAIAALREEGLARASRLVTVCNEITPDSRAALAEGLITLVIATPLERLSRELVAQMGHAIETGGTGTPGQIFLPFDMHISETI